MAGGYFFVVEIIPQQLSHWGAWGILVNLKEIIPEGSYRPRARRGYDPVPQFFAYRADH